MIGVDVKLAGKKFLRGFIYMWFQIIPDCLNDHGEGDVFYRYSLKSKMRSIKEAVDDMRLNVSGALKQSVLRQPPKEEPIYDPASYPDGDYEGNFNGRVLKVIEPKPSPKTAAAPFQDAANDHWEAAEAKPAQDREPIAPMADYFG